MNETELRLLYDDMVKAITTYEYEDGDLSFEAFKIVMKRYIKVE